MEARHGHHHGGHKHRHPRLPALHAKITITIPRGALSLPSLRSIFPGMSQDIGNVLDDVEFDYLTLIGKSVSVDVSLLSSPGWSCRGLTFDC